MYDVSDPHEPVLLARANLLIFEIGNSHVTVATAIHGQVCSDTRHAKEDVDGVMETAHAAWEGLPDREIRSVVAASVVPTVLQGVRDRFAKEFQSPFQVVGEDIRLPILVAVETPERVGIDRICAAAAAYDRIQRACVVASFGTAVTIDCVTDEGVFMGGAILPGLETQARALHRDTAALPLVSIEPSGVVFGTTTEQAIRNGVLHGAVGSLREIVERYATALGAWPQLVITGGHAELILSECEFVDNHVPDLCIRGIALAHRRHFSPPDAE